MALHMAHPSTEVVGSIGSDVCGLEREMSSPREVERTILFSDVVASTALISEHGNFWWLQLIRRHRDTVRTVARRHGGTVIGFAGDGFLVVFGRPVDGVECALRLQVAFAVQDLAGIRVGIHCGPVISFDGNYTGLAVHLASRFTDLSMPGEVVMSEACYLAARRDGALPPLESRSVPVRGISEPVAVRVSRPVSDPWLA